MKMSPWTVLSWIRSRVPSVEGWRPGNLGYPTQTQLRLGGSDTLRTESMKMPVPRYMMQVHRGSEKGAEYNHTGTLVEWSPRANYEVC